MERLYKCFKDTQLVSIIAKNLDGLTLETAFMIHYYLPTKGRARSKVIMVGRNKKASVLDTVVSAQVREVHHAADGPGIMPWGVHCGEKDLQSLSCFCISLAFGSGLFFQGCLHIEQPSKTELISPSGTEEKFVYCRV